MKIHPVAATLLLISIPCYLYSEKLGIGLGILGILVELIAWVILISSDIKEPRDNAE